MGTTIKQRIKPMHWVLLTARHILGSKAWPLGSVEDRLLGVDQ